MWKITRRYSGWRAVQWRLSQQAILQRGKKIGSGRVYELTSWKWLWIWHTGAAIHKNVEQLIYHPLGVAHTPQQIVQNTLPVVFGMCVCISLMALLSPSSQTTFPLRVSMHLTVFHTDSDLILIHHFLVHLCPPSHCFWNRLVMPQKLPRSAKSFRFH